MSNYNQNKYLIIVGTNKAGTTSLFKYLSDHPQVAGAYVKQTGFFLDKNYKMAQTHFIHHFDDDPSKYDTYFENITLNTKYKLEASPDYMYSENTPRRLNRFFDENRQVILIFILRNPVDRFLSWYSYAKQIGLVGQDVTLHQFIQMNNDKNKSRAHEHMCFNALETGRYQKYIDRFKKFEFPTYIFDYEKLTANPQKFLMGVAEELSIDSSFYIGYDFKILNATKKVKNTTINNLYIKIKKTYYTSLYRIPAFNKLFSPLLSVVAGLYRSYNLSEKPKEQTDEASLRFLKQYYQEIDRK